LGTPVRRGEVEGAEEMTLGAFFESSMATSGSTYMVRSVLSCVRA
jgi:hypothetical protein